MERFAALAAGVMMFIALAGAHGAAGDDAPAPAYREAPPSTTASYGEVEEFCPPANATWREAQTIFGVDLAADPSCSPDDPRVVAAVTKGTNNVPMSALKEAGLSRDAVEKGRDLDGDGDPDIINITLEVAELNGKAAADSGLSASHEIAPGIAPGYWVFAPKTMGMATEGSAASNLLRAPSPVIRVEQGDRINIKLENTHYMPHTIHFHGADHPFISNGSGNDGVPQVSEQPVSPGSSRTYKMTPRTPGTMFYHCHVQPSTHVLMGLQGMFAIEPEAANNTVQTFNVGAGKVRHPSTTSEQEYDSEYDMHYTGVDMDLHSIINVSDDPRIISKIMNRGYDVTERVPDYFTVNGRSFPYTVRESQIIVEPDQRSKIRVLNGGAESLSLHTHGHKATITHYDGVTADPAARITRDVFDVSAAQRIDLVLNTTDNGLHSYGEGVWFMHNHNEKAVTNDGIAPGGDISLITYRSMLQDNGFPVMNGVSWEPYFTENYYQREVPVWQAYEGPRLFGAVQKLPASSGEIGVIALIGLLAGAAVTLWVMSR